MRAIFERDFLFFARRKRFFIMRSVTVGLPAILMIMIVSLMRNEGAPEDAIGLAMFFSTMLPLLVMVLFLVPSMLAPVLADEKRNNRLDVLRSSPISTASIVIGKWTSRYALVMSVCLAAMPVSAVALLFGGVAPSDFFQAAAVILLTILWVSALSLMISAYSKDLSVAMRLTYMAVIGYFVISIIAMPMSWTTGVRGGALGWLQYAGMFLWSINPMGIILGIGTPGVPQPLPALGITWHPVMFYAVFSGVVAVTTFMLAIVGLGRDESAKGNRKAQTDEGEDVSEEASASREVEQPRFARQKGRFSKRRRLLTHAPAMWLEVQRGALWTKTKWKLIVFILLLLALEGSFIAILVETSRYGRDEEIHIFPLLASLAMAFFSAASMGAASFHRDNEARTLEVLHSTPLTTKSLSAGKVWGTVRQASWWWWISQAHMLFAVVLGDYMPWTALLYAMFTGGLLVSLVSFSMLMSLKSDSVVKASVRTFAVVIGHLIVFPVVFFILAAAASTFDEHTALFFLGQHPFFISMLPILFEDDGFVRDADGWWWGVIYWIGYVILAMSLIGTAIPGNYARKRSENWGV